MKTKEDLHELLKRSLSKDEQIIEFMHVMAMLNKNLYMHGRYNTSVSLAVVSENMAELELMFEYQWADGRKLGFEAEPSPEELNHAFDADMHDRISQTAEKYGVPAPLALGVSKTESNMDQTDAHGNLLHNPESSAIGVFQLTKAARKDVGLKDEGNPVRRALAASHAAVSSVKFREPAMPILAAILPPTGRVS